MAWVQKAYDWFSATNPLDTKFTKLLDPRLPLDEALSVLWQDEEIKQKPLTQVLTALQNAVNKAPEPHEKGREWIFFLCILAISNLNDAKVMKELISMMKDRGDQVFQDLSRVPEHILSSLKKYAANTFLGTTPFPLVHGVLSGLPEWVDKVKNVNRLSEAPYPLAMKRSNTTIRFITKLLRNDPHTQEGYDSDAILHNVQDYCEDVASNVNSAELQQLVEVINGQRFPNLRLFINKYPMTQNKTAFCIKELKNYGNLLRFLATRVAVNFDAYFHACRTLHNVPDYLVLDVVAEIQARRGGYDELLRSSNSIWAVIRTVEWSPPQTWSPEVVCGLLKIMSSKDDKFTLEAFLPRLFHNPHEDTLTFLLGMGNRILPGLRIKVLCEYAKALPKDHDMEWPLNQLFDYMDNPSANAWWMNMSDFCKTATWALVNAQPFISLARALCSSRCAPNEYFSNRKLDDNDGTMFRHALVGPFMLERYGQLALPAFTEFPNTKPKDLAWLPVVLPLAKSLSKGGGVWEKVFQAMERIVNELDQYSLNHLLLLDLSALHFHVPGANERYVEYMDTFKHEQNRIKRIKQLETILKTCGAVSEITTANLILDDMPLCDLVNIQADFLLDNDQAEKIAFHFLVDNESLLFRTKLSALAKASYDAVPKLLLSTLSELKRLFGTSETKLGDFQSLTEFRRMSKKEDLGREIGILQRHFGTNLELASTEALASAEAILNWKSHMPALLLGFNEVRNVTKQIPADFQDKFELIEAWQEQDVNDIAVFAAPEHLARLHALLPGLSTKHHALFVKLGKAKCLNKVLLEQFGAEETDFSRMVEMIRRNAGDNEEEIELMESLRNGRDALGLLQTNLCFDEWFASVSRFLERPNVLDQLERCIQQVDRIDGLAARLKDGDSLSHLLCVEINGLDCVPRFSNGEHLGLEEAISQMKPNSVVYTVLDTCRSIHKNVLKGRDLGCSAIPDKFILYHAPGYVDKDIPDGKAVFVENLNVSVVVEDELEEEEEVRVVPVRVEEQQQRQGRGASFLHRLTPAEIAVVDMTNRAVVEAVMRNCFGEDFSSSRFQALFQASTASDLFAFADNLERALVDKFLTITKEVGVKIGEKIAEWEEEVNKVRATNPDILMLYNNQLRWLLRNAKPENWRVICKLCNVPCREFRVHDLDAFTRLFPLLESDIEVRGKLQVVNLGLANSRPEVMALTMAYFATHNNPMTPSNLLWCSAQTTSSLVESFVHRASKVPNQRFVLICPSRLDHGARRSLVTSVSKQISGCLAIVFDDHEVETALHRALGAERVESRSKPLPVPQLQQLVRDKRRCPNTTVKVVQGRVGDGKSWMVEGLIGDKRSLRIGVHELFSADKCSTRVLNELHAARNGPIAIHLDVIGGQSIVDPTNFYSSTMGERVAGSKVLKPLEEMEKFLFNFACLGFLLDESSGECYYIENHKVDIYVELPGDMGLVDMLDKYLFVCSALKSEVIDVSKQRPKYVAADADDLFACWILKQNFDFNVGDLYEAMRWWKQSFSANDSAFPRHVALSCHEVFEQAMPGWTRRRQRFAIRALCERFGRLARFGCFHALKSFGQNSAGELQNVDLSSVNLSTIQVAFMIDATGSMSSHLQQAKEKVVSTMRDVKSKHPHAEMSFACVLYRGYSTPDRLEMQNFTTAEKLTVWLTPKRAHGGDACEDVAGGLDAVAKLQWTAATRNLVWIGDMAAHTPRYNGGLYDSHPLGYAPGMQHTYTDPQISIRALWEKTVRIFFFKITEYTDHMIRVLKADYEQPGKDLKLEQFEIGSRANLFLEKTLQSIDISLEHVTNANKKLVSLGRLSIETILGTFSEHPKDSETLVVVGGDEIQGCSAVLVSRSGPTKNTDEQLYLDQCTDAEIRNVIAVALGLSSKSSAVEESLRKMNFAMTKTIAYRTLAQIETHASHSCTIMSGGTGVGKSEGARLQTQLALEQGSFDLPFELRIRLLQEFVYEPDLWDVPLDPNHFVTANIKLAKAANWKPAFQKATAACSEKEFSSCVFLYPVTLCGHAPFMLEKHEIARLKASSESCEVYVAHNGVDSFVIKAKRATPQANVQVHVLFDDTPVPGSPFAVNFEATKSADAVMEEDPVDFLANRVPTARQCCLALNNAAKLYGEEIKREEAQQRFARRIVELLSEWIPENALVPRIAQKHSAMELLQDLENKIEKNPKDSLQELGTFADSLRLPSLMFKLCLHPSTQMQAIEQLVGRAVHRMAKILSWANHRKFAWASNLSCTVFFDELNTSSFPGLIKQLVLDRHLNGKPLADMGHEYSTHAARDNESSEDLFDGDEQVERKFYYQAEDLVFFLGAVNPPDSMYTVTRLPQALDEVTKVVGELDEDMVRELSQALFRQNIKGVLTQGEIREATDLVVLSHRTLTNYRKDYPEMMSKVWASIRNVVRVVRLATFFVQKPELLFRLEQKSEQLSRDKVVKYAKSTCADGVELRRRAVLLAVGTSYWLALNKTKDGVDLRQDFATKVVDPLVKSWKLANGMTVPAAMPGHFTFVSFMQRQVDCIVERMSSLLEVEHALTQPLREHFYAITVCSQAKIPMLIVGPPGCSKSLAVNLTLGGFKSERQVEVMFPSLQLHVLDEYSMQCSELSTAKEISSVFAQASKTFRGDGRTHSVVFLDEASLAPRALKALHEPLDLGVVACVMNSNLVLDAAKTNRCLLVRRDEFGDDSKDLLCLAKSSVGIKQSDQGDFPFLKACIAAYQTLVADKSAVQSTFHLRHFLYFMRALRRNVGEFTQDPKHVATALARNFGGLKESQFSIHVGVPFFEEIQRHIPNFPSFPPPAWQYDVVELIEAAVQATEYEYNKQTTAQFNPSLHCARNLLLVNHGEGLSWLTAMWRNVPANMQRATVSMFPSDDNAVGRDAVINQVVDAMKSGTTVFLHGGDKRVYSAFYDAFNMRFSKLGDQYFVSVAIGTIWKSVKYNPKFKCIVVIDGEMYNEMRSPQSNMLPFLSRFEAFCVAPEEMLASHTVLQRLLGVAAVDNASLGWISSATHHVAKFIENGHGCFMGADPNQSWDVASSLVLGCLQNNPRTSVDTMELAQEIADDCIARLIHTARPEALALRSSSEWIPKPLLRSYVESADDHFSLMRLLRATGDVNDGGGGKRLVITRSAGVLSLASEVKARAGGLKNVCCIESFETVEQFERELDGRNKKEPVVLLANLSFVGADQLQHVFRIVDAKRYSNVVCIAHRASEELALDQMSIGMFARGWRTVFVDDPVGSMEHEHAAPTRALLCAFRADDEAEDGAEVADAGLLDEVIVLCRNRVKLAAPLQSVEVGGSVASQFYAGRRTFADVMQDCVALREFVHQQAKRLLNGQQSEKSQIYRATDRISRDKLGGSDSISFESAIVLATGTFREDTILSIVHDLCAQGNLFSILEWLEQEESDRRVLEALLDATLHTVKRQMVEIVAPPTSSISTSFPFFAHHRDFKPELLGQIAAHAELSRTFLIDCLRVVHEVPVDDPVALQLALHWMLRDVDLPLNGDVLFQLSAPNNNMKQQVQDIAWKSRFLVPICTMQDIAELKPLPSMLAEDFALKIVRYGVECIVSNVDQNKDAIETMTAVRDLLSMSREHAIGNLLRSTCKSSKELLFALVFHAGVSSARDANMDIKHCFQLRPSTLQECLKLWPIDDEQCRQARISVFASYLRFAPEEIMKNKQALSTALEQVNAPQAYTYLLYLAMQQKSLKPEEFYKMVQHQAPQDFLTKQDETALNMSTGWLYYFNQDTEQGFCKQFGKFQQSRSNAFRDVEHVYLLDRLAGEMNRLTLPGFMQHACDACQMNDGRLRHAAHELMRDKPTYASRFVGLLHAAERQRLLELNAVQLEEFALARDVLLAAHPLVQQHPFYSLALPALVDTLQTSLTSLCLFQECAPVVYSAYCALVRSRSDADEEEENRLSMLVQGEAFAEDGAYEKIRKALQQDGELPLASEMTVEQAIGANDQCGCLVRAIVMLGRQASAAIDVAAARDQSWDVHGVSSCVVVSSSPAATLYSFTCTKVTDAAKKEFQAAVALCLQSTDEAAMLIRLERLWLELFNNTKVVWREEDFILTRSEANKLLLSAPPSALQQQVNDQHDDDDDEDDLFHLARFDMLDQTGKALARAIRHPCVPNSVPAQQPLFAAGILAKEKQRMLTVPKHGGDTRVLAYSEAPRLLKSWEAGEEHLIATCWACVDVLLERNSRFSRLDVVLQSKPVPRVKFERKRLLRLGSTRPKATTKAIKDLVQFLLRSDIVIKLAEDSTAPISTQLDSLSATPQNDQLVRDLVPEHLTGASLSEFLLLLLEVKSRLGLRLFLKREAFATKVETPQDLYVGNRYLHPPRSFLSVASSTAAATQEEEPLGDAHLFADDFETPPRHVAVRLRKFGQRMMDLWKPATGKVEEDDRNEEEEEVVPQTTSLLLKQQPNKQQGKLLLFVVFPTLLVLLLVLSRLMWSKA